MPFGSNTIVRCIFTCNEKDFYNKDRTIKYSNSQVYYALFSAYWEDSNVIELDDNQMPIDKEVNGINPRNTSKYLLGNLKVPRYIRDFYLYEYDEESYGNDLQLIIPMLGTMANSAVREIRKQLNNDSFFPQKEKELLQQKFPEEHLSDERVAYFFAAAFYSSFRNECAAPKKANARIETRCAFPLPSIDFCGRDNEIKKLHHLLKAHNKVFLYGVPGIGKSELAKAYANKTYNSKNSIVYISYSGNLKNDITILQFANDKKKESKENKFEKHYNYIKALTPKDLLLIDNFNPNPNNEKLFEEILSLKCRVLFTTTMSFNNVHTMELKRIESNEILLSWFENQYTQNSEQKKILENIIDILEGHTFAVKLVSSLVNDCFIEPSDILEKLSQRNLLSDYSDELEVRKDNQNNEATYTEHINALFNIYNLTADQIHMMKHFCLFPSSGVSGKDLKQLLKLKNMNIIKQLSKMGLVQQDLKGTFSIHSLTKDYILSQYPPSAEEYHTLIEDIQNTCKQNPDYNPKPHLLFAIIENYIRFAKKENIVSYLRFLIDISANVDTYHYSPLEKIIFSEIERIENNEEIKDSNILTELYFYLGTHQKDIGIAKKWLLLAEKCTIWNSYEGQDNGLLISKIYNALGNVYMVLNDYESAINILYTAWETNPHTEITSSFSQIQNIATCIIKTGDYDSGITLLKDYSEKIKTKVGKFNTSYASFMQFIGILYLCNNQLELGEKHIIHALTYYTIATQKQVDYIKARKKDIVSFYNKHSNSPNSEYIETFLDKAISEIIEFTTNHININKI